MSDLPCKGLCPPIQILQWKQGNDWTRQDIFSPELRVQDRGQVPSIVSKDTEVFMIIASETNIQECVQCREIFTNTFCIPSTLWKKSIRNSNGYFGCESTSDPDVPGLNTWAYFEVKHLELNMKYDWSKLNIFTRWIPSTNQTAIVLFDPAPRIEQIKPQPSPAHLKDPFWPYLHFLQEVITLQESAVWAIRDHVRNIEKEKKPRGRPLPDYRRLHDIARHAIHVTESLDVAVQSIEHITRHHSRYAHNSSKQPQQNDPTTTSLCLTSSAPMNIHSNFEFSQSCLSSLRHRSLANEKRLQNEIQLAFNTVAQHDASLTVKISHAMMSDSTALKTLAFVTFAFLPPTFISSIFSMSFFKYDNGIFSVSREIWIYWAFAIPTTIVSTLVWSFWHKISPKERREAPLMKQATFELREMIEV